MQRFAFNKTGMTKFYQEAHEVLSKLYEKEFVIISAYVLSDAHQIGIHFEHRGGRGRITYDVNRGKETITIQFSELLNKTVETSNIETAIKKVADAMIKNADAEKLAAERFLKKL